MKSDKKENTNKKQRDKEVLYYFLSLPKIGYINKEGITIIPK